jgi:hypothetical protein
MVRALRKLLRARKRKAILQVTVHQIEMIFLPYPDLDQDKPELSKRFT